MTQFFFFFFFFFFNDTATTEIYTLSLHDALPIYILGQRRFVSREEQIREHFQMFMDTFPSIFADRKSTRLNSSHQIISYAVFCLKKKTRSALTMATLSASRASASPS